MTVTDAAAMPSAWGSGHQKSENSGPPVPFALWPVDLRLTHLDWNPEATLVHFQGQHLTLCELDYNILQGEIQNVPKTKAAVDIGEFCLVEDLTSARWYRGRVHNQKEGLFDVFLIDHGNVLSVDISNISSCSNDLFILPPKIVCGFLANVLLLQGCSHSVVEEYFSNLIGREVTGYIQALLPYKVLLLEASDINIDLVSHGFGRHVDTNTFLLLVEMLTEVPITQNVEPVPDILIENPRGQEFCFKPSGLQAYEQILSFCGPRLSCGTRAKVHVTAAVNPGLFYCQMASMETDLWEMSKKLAAVCEYRTKERSQKTSENLGLLCSVKRKDGKWYRGFVQFLPVNSQLRVLFVDYGFFETVKVENIHRLPPDFDSKPIMAFPCSLFSLSDQDAAARTQQLSLLKAGVLGRVLDVEIKSFDEEKHLYSIAVIGAEDNHVKEPKPIQKLPGNKMESVIHTNELSPQGGYLYLETAMCDVFGKTLEEEEVHVGSVFVGFVEHVENPNHFWIRTQKRNCDFEEMMTKMTDHFSQVKLDEDVLLNPDLGTLCCAVYEEDMHFYRGVVTDTLEHGAEVFFIDFGNIEKVPHMLIKKIPETFAIKSAFAFCCSLVNVVPLDELWTSTACDFFRRAVSNRALLINIVQMKKNKVVVDLSVMGSDSSRSITELLISAKHAECWNYIPTELMVQNSTDVTKKTTINENTENSEDCQMEGKRCKSETEKPQAPACFKVLSIKPGFEFPVCCSNIDSPSDFWCQLQNKVPALEELMDKIQLYCSTHTVTVQSDESCCLAKSPHDGRWYRAFITQKQKRRARVMFVDYGCTIQVEGYSLQAIIPEYVYLEEQAFRCSLYNLIEPADPKDCLNWSPEVCNLLKDFVHSSGSGLRCKVVSQLNIKNKGLCNVVDLYNAKTQQSITSLLLKQGLARETTISTKQKSVVFPESFVFSSYGVTPGNEEQVIVTYVSSQLDIFCHLERNNDIIEELEKKILEESEKMMQASTKAVVRKLCLAKYLDGKWYRGLAHPVQSPMHLNVFFVDYGNANISDKTHVMFIPRDSADLLYTPMQAVKCNLASVSKETLYADAKDWLDVAILNKQVRALVVGKHDDGSFDVELFDGEVSINEKVNELISTLSPKPKTAVSTKLKDQSPHKRNTKPSVSHKSRCEGLSSNSVHGMTKVGSASRKKKENSKSNIQSGAQAENTNVKLQKEEDTKNNVPVKCQKIPLVKQQKQYCRANTKSKQPQKTEIPQLSCSPNMKVHKGFRGKCFVSHIDSVNSFFLQLSEDEPAILKMEEELNSGTLRDSLKPATSLRINDLVLAEYEEDGALYRSTVKGYKGSSCFTVEFVDYGNSAVMGKEKLYSIPKEYLSQPRFSISCSLLDPSTYKDDTSFIDAVMEKPLMVDFVHQYGNHWEVRVEVLDGTVGLLVPLEAAIGRGAETEKQEEVLTGSSEIEERVTFCEQNYLEKEASEKETTESQKVMPAVDGKNLMLKPLPAKPKVITCRHHREPTKIKNDSKMIKSKTMKFFVKVQSDGEGAVSPLSIQVNNTENCTVLSVLSNGSFYVRLNETSELLSALESRINDKLYKCEMIAEEDVKQGLMYLVQVNKNNQWHRAFVQHVCGGKCQVLLMDLGITHEIPSCSIRRLCKSLRKIPRLAVLCKVNVFGFSEGEDAYKPWYETLKSMLGKEVKLTFVHYSQADELWMVEMSVNEFFVINQVTTSKQQNEEIIPSPSETQNEKAEGKPGLDTSRPQQLAFSPIDLEKAYSGFAAAVTTPFEFCVVLEDSLLVINKVSAMLDDLPEQMCPFPEAHLVTGTCCLFKSDTKKKWCRAEIVHCDTTVILNLVDHGHYEYMPYENCSSLKRLPVEMTDLPKVTYPCILRGVKPVGADGQWTDEAAVFFQRCLYQKNLQIFFRELISNNHWKVDILADDVHVAKELVDAGHACYIDIMLRLRFQEQSPHKAAHQIPDNDEEGGQEDEVSDRKLELSVESTDEAAWKMILSNVSGSRHCLLM